MIFYFRLQTRRLEEEKQELVGELNRLRELTENGETLVDVVSKVYYSGLSWFSISKWSYLRLSIWN